MNITLEIGKEMIVTGNTFLIEKDYTHFVSENIDLYRQLYTL